MSELLNDLGCSLQGNWKTQEGGSPPDRNAQFEHIAQQTRAFVAADEPGSKEKKLTGADLAMYRQHHAGPVLAAFAGWRAEQRPRVLPKSSIGEAITYASNQ